MPTKAVGAMGGSGLAGSIVTLIIAFTGVPTKGGVSPEIFVGALTTVVAVIAAGLGAYLPKMEGAQ